MEPPLLRIADVAVEARAFGAEAIFSYLASDSTKPGQAHMVTVASRQAVGYVVSVRDVPASALGFDPNKLKPLGDSIHGIEIPGGVVQLIRQVSEDTLTSIPVALSLAIPPGLKERLVTEWVATGESVEARLSAVQQEVLEAVASAPMLESKASKLEEPIRRALAALKKLGLVAQRQSVGKLSSTRGSEKSYCLSKDTARLDAFLQKEGKKRPAQAVTIMRLQGAEDVSLTKGEIRTLAGVTDQTIRSLISAGLLIESESTHVMAIQPPTPNAAQQEAIERISKGITAHSPEVHLLYGITGSGKTEVFLRCASEALRIGRSVLYVVPEIALTAQVVAQLRARFGSSVAVLHSNMSPGDRMESWLAVQRGSVSVVLGARSAIFAPLANVGLIVLDEEHEASYKQESSPRYHAKNAAMALAEYHGCPVVLGSATPSIETFCDAVEGRIGFIELPKRAVSAAKLPEVEVIDLRELFKARRAAILAPPLHDAIETALAKGEQVMLFLNRRAYAPFVQCRDCGQKFVCPRCEVTMSFHLHDRTLRCHHCDHHEPAPTVCPRCQGTRVGAIGVGVEKVQESVSALFPEVVVERLDRDVTRKKGALEDILARFRSNDIQILVGTQMIAKGLDFPNVTVVGVISADVSLNLPDFRASERTFQLLTQVAGRAGRGEKEGRVFIQTFEPENIAVVTSQNHDYWTLYHTLRAEREVAGYPPFRRLVRVLCSGPNKPSVVQVSANIASRLAVVMKNAEILGPTDCALSKLSDQYRRHVLLKLPPGSDVTPIKHAVDGCETNKVSITIDVDPYNLI